MELYCTHMPTYVSVCVYCYFGLWVKRLTLPQILLLAVTAQRQCHDKL